MRSILFVLPALLWASPALADDGGQPTDLEKLLNSIPDIETKAPPPVETPKEPEGGLDFPTYTRELREAVLSHWEPNPKLIAKNPRLTCQMLVKVNPDGTLGDALMAQSSGDKKFDASAVAAVLATARIEPPPDSLRGTVSQGVLVNFVAAAAAAKSGK